LSKHCESYVYNSQMADEEKGKSPIQIQKTDLLIMYLDAIKKEEALGGNHTRIRHHRQ